MATDLIAYRGRNDDGSESTATWKRAQNEPWIQAKDVNFRVRFLHQQSGSPINNLDVRLQYNLNGAGWVDVTGTSNVVRSTATANVADQANLTQQMTGGTGAFEGATAFDEANGICGGNSFDIAATENFETEFCVQVRGVNTADGDIIELRTINSDAGTAWDTYTVVAQLFVTFASQDVADTLGLTEDLASEILAATGTRLRFSWDLFDDEPRFNFDALSSGGATLTQAVDDTISLTEALARVVSREISESVVLTEALIKQATQIGRDTIGLTESKALMIGKLAAETVTLSEDLTIQIQKSFAETGDFTEALAPVVLRLASMSDTAVLTEALQLQAAKIAQDTLGLSETDALQVGKTVADTLGFGESLATEAFGTAAQSIDDTVTLTEALTRQVRKGIAENPTLTEALYGEFDLAPLSEDFDFTETLSRIITTGSVVQESLGLSDVLTVQAQTLLRLANPETRRFAFAFFDDEYRLEQTSADTTTQGKAVADALATAETLVRQTQKIITENPVLSESLERAISRTIAETVGLTETKKVGIIVSDTLTFNESLTKEIIFPSAGVFAESLGLSETFRRYVARTITDTLGLTENLTASKTVLRTLSDSVVFAEMLAAVQTLQDQITFGETLTAIRVAAPAVPVRIIPLWEDTELHKVTIYGAVGMMGGKVYGATKWTEQGRQEARTWTDASLHDVTQYGAGATIGERPYGATKWQVSL